MAKMTKPLNEASGLPARMRGYYETARGWLTDNVSDAAIADRVTGSASSLLSRVGLTPSIPPSLTPYRPGAARGPGNGFIGLGAVLGGGLGAGYAAYRGDGRYTRRSLTGAAIGSVGGAAFDPRARALASSTWGKVAGALSRLRK
jgi:hypothetical protein